IDLTGRDLLRRLGITDDVLVSADQAPCRLIGSAANWLGHDGILVPSARRVGGTNLVIYQQDPSTDVFEVTNEEVISPDQRLG
ncbi:MAG TPA: RES family NAD+ phosphorylase, partial [Thermoanaerobaculia bacterium]|nr:RES family NAD+ phosphorylase [Thermoanaerobaculia bacterium]